MTLDRLPMRGPLASAKARMRALARDERGVTAIEFGVLALPFFTVIFAILQTAIMFLASQVLDSALEDASRKVRTGEAASYSIDQFRTLMCDSTYNLIDCSQIQLKSEVISGFANVVSTVPQSCHLTSCTWTAKGNMSGAKRAPSRPSTPPSMPRACSSPLSSTPAKASMIWR